MKNIMKTGISSNMLKTIAVIAMVIDHIGFYFVQNIPITIYIAVRRIGRIAMPIFVYLLVQGFFHTKNFKKYIIRIFILAIITQILVTALMWINITYVPGYTYAKQIYTNGNILFTFTVCLGIMKLLHEDILIKKWDYNKNRVLKLIVISMILIICIFIPLDYAITATILCILLYFIEKFKISIMIKRTRPNINLEVMALNLLDENKIKCIYLSLIFLSIFLVTIYFNSSFITLLSILPIALYNGDRGKSNKFVKNMYYIMFPLQHVLLYSLAMLKMFT